MTEEQNNVYLLGQIAMLNAKIAGMVAENQHHMAVYEVPMYREDAFESVANESGVYPNAIIGSFQDIANRG